MERQHIIQNTTVLLKKYGLKSMTVAEISSRLGISNNTFYNNFKNKEALLRECLSLMNADVRALANLQHSGDFVGALADIYQKTIAYLSEFDSTFYFDLRKNTALVTVTRQHISEYSDTIIRPIIQQAKDSGLMFEGTTVDDAVSDFMQFVPHFFTGFKDDPQAIERHLATFLKRFFNADSR